MLFSFALFHIRNVRQEKRESTGRCHLLVIMVQVALLCTSCMKCCGIMGVSRNEKPLPFPFPSKKWWQSLFFRRLWTCLEVNHHQFGGEVVHLSWSPTLLNILSSAWYDRYSYVGCQLLATQLLHFLPHHRLTLKHLPRLCFFRVLLPGRRVVLPATKMPRWIDVR